MTNGIRRWLGVAIIPLTLLMFGIAAPAHATVYKCDNDTTQPTVPDLPTTLSETNVLQDSIIIPQTPPGGCVINVDLFARDQIEINVSSGNLDAKEIVSTDSRVFIDVANGNLKTTAGESGKGDIEAGNVIQLFTGVSGTGSTGDIEIAGDIISNLKDIQTGNANILIKAKGSIIVEEVKTNGTVGAESVRSGAIQIDVNLGGSNGDIAIGGSAANIGSIDTRSKQGGGQNVLLIESGVRITNGTANSTGNMTVQVLSDIMVKNTESRAGRIELNTNKGTLTLAGGALDADGDLTNDEGAGSIYLFAETIEFLGDAVVTTSQSDDADGVVHQIILAASTIDFQAADELQILSDGKGANDSQPAIIYVLPQGGITSTSTDNVFSLLWQLSFTGTFFEFPGEVHFDGGTEADLTIRADGEHSQIGITGDNIIFDGNDITVQARGRNNSKHEIVMGFFDFDAYDGSKGLEMNNKGVTLFNVRGFGGPTNSGGDIQIQVDKADLNLDRWNIRARGGANVGDGGTILFTTSEINLSLTTLLDLNADASLNGSGNAQVLRNNRKAITFGFGKSEINIGRGKERIQFSANGGGAGGNAGAIDIFGNSSESTTKILLENNEHSITARAPGPDGNGGFIRIFSANIVEIVQDAIGQPARLAIEATGGTDSGIGGQITINDAFTFNPFDTIEVNAIMKVNGGPATTGENLWGMIQINNVFCFQSKSPFNDFPKSYWQCAAVTTPISTHGLELATTVNNALNLSSVVHSSMKNQLASTKTSNNPTVQIYAMNNIDNFHAFFNTPAPLDTILVFGRSIPKHRVSAAFDNVRNTAGILIPSSVAAGAWEPDATPIPTIREHTILHEVGHQFDYIWGNPTQLTQPPQPSSAWELAQGADISAVPGIDLLSLTQERPCQPTFSSVTCGLPQVQGLPNSQVFLSRYAGNDNQVFQRELFAMMFADILADPLALNTVPELERFLDFFPTVDGHLSNLMATQQTVVN